ncbi:retrotransposon gag domain, retroviral aspartyl protease [Tanacetum coccineum]
MGEADVILGIKIKRETKGIVITQSHYIEKILKKFNREDFSPVSTPMDPVEKLKPNTGKPVDQLEYSRAIGYLMYAMTSTRPDIAYVVGRLNRFTSNPSRQHWKAITRIFKYLRGTKDYGLSYVGYPSVLKGYSDASWINHVEDSSSTSGWVFLLGGGAISWASKKQTCITGSTMESEFVALAAAGKEAEWLRNLIHEIPIWPKPIAPISIRCDSVLMMAKAYSQVYNGKSRHLGVRHSMIRKLIMKGYSDTNLRVYTRKKTRVKARDQVQFNDISGSWVDPLGQQTSWRPAISNLAWLLPKFQSFDCLNFLVLSLVPSPGNESMVQTRSNSDTGNQPPPDPIAVQLAAMAKKLESIDALQKDVAALKSQSQKTDQDPRGWILKAEKYFRYYDIPEEEKVDVASMHLEGDALDFYSWASTNQTMEYWEDLVRALQKIFGPTEFQNPDEYLCSLKQTGTVQEYRQEFAKRSSRVSNWPEHCLLGVFLNGLKEELKADVRIQKPRTVYKAVSIALEFESKISHTRSGRGSTWTTPSKSTQPESKVSTYTPTSSNINSKPPLQISDADRQSRYLRGECYRCGEKYGPGHRCKTGTLKVLEVEEEPDEQPTDEIDYIAGDANDVAEISLHAILGKAHPRTMKVQGMLQSTTDVIILVDGGSTHNFISDVLVRDLKLNTQLVAPFGVQIGNGDFVRCSHICKNLTVQVNELKIVQDFFPFSIGGADLVLGIQWLETLNTVQANWKEMFMIFNVDGKRYKWQGISTGSQTSSSFQHLAVEPCTIPEIPNILQPVINRYKPVFEEPKTLPPNHSQNHSIPLPPNSTRPNIRPYRYPHSQKAEIEKQVEELLAAGFIRPSNIPFSSPILLVKKKDNTWRMCVDYRALNKIAIADKYPIPNTGYHTSTGTTPFSVVYGRDHPSLLPYVMGETKNAELEQQLIDGDDMLKLLRVNLTKVQDRMRNQANSKRREVTFQVGDYAFLKIQPYRQKSLAKRRYEKLSPRSFGPYRVKRAIGLVAYDLKSPDDAKIHRVFPHLHAQTGSWLLLSTVASLPITKNWEIDV